MWLLERCRKEWPDTGYEELIRASEQAEPFRSLINPDDPLFANPQSMTQAIAEYCRRTSQPAPETVGQYVRCIFESLALRYRQVIEMLKSLSPHPIERLYVIGGGARNGCSTASRPTPRAYPSRPDRPSLPPSATSWCRRAMQAWWIPPATCAA